MLWLDGKKEKKINGDENAKWSNEQRRRMLVVGKVGEGARTGWPPTDEDETTLA